jgi:hypothetical protein
MRRVLLAVALLGVLAATAPSCLSPTLPLPPPDHPDAISQDSTGLWQVSGHCDVGATVLVSNARTGFGVSMQDLGNHGTYHLALPGQPCDLARVQELLADGEWTQATGFLLQDYNNGAPVDPSSCP